jgi:small-conductance mechanosensitive channel
MEVNAGGEMLADFIGTLVKLLSRPVVWWQLIAVGAALVLADWVSKRVSALIDRKFFSVLARQKQADELRIETEGRFTMDPDARRQLVGRWRLIEALVAGSRQIIYPLLSIVFAYAAYVLLGLFGMFNGLIGSIIFLLWIYLFYSFLIGLIYAVGNRKKVRYYHTRLLIPLFLLFVGSRLLSSVVNLNALTSQPLLTLFGESLTLGGLLLVVVGLPLWLVATGAIRDVLLWVLSRRRAEEQTRGDGSLVAALTLLRYLLIVVGLFVTLALLGLNATTIAAITGGLSIGIGLALQDVLRNFLGGLIVLFEGTVKPGDWVEVGGHEGEVENLSIRATIVRTFDNVEFIVPNQEWLTETVTTFTRTNRQGRTRVPISVAFGSDVQAVQALLVATALQHPLVLPEPQPLAPILDFGTFSINYIVLAWVADAKDRALVGSELRMMFWNALKAHGIQVPYPQSDVHLRAAPPGLAEAEG